MDTLPVHSTTKGRKEGAIESDVGISVGVVVDLLQLSSLDGLFFSDSRSSFEVGGTGRIGDLEVDDLMESSSLDEEVSTY